MDEAFVREIALIGEEGFARLQNAHVAVFGIGGVGSYVAEALVRAGVGTLTMVDGDAVAESNLNRQIVALHSTLGRNKAEVMAARAADIAPACDVRALPLFFGQDTAPLFDFSAFSYVADCIDRVTDKVLLLKTARAAGVPVLSCMGAGNRLTADFKVSPVEQTRGCPLARIVRRECRAAGVTGVKAVYSEQPSAAMAGTVSSISFVPSMAGLTLAGALVRDLLGGAAKQ